MAKGQKVTLVTGNTGNKVTVPDETNQSVQLATQQLQGLGLTVQTQPSSNCTQLNIVCSQNPTGGTQVNQNSTVTLFTAAAPTTTTSTTTSTTPTTAVPDVSGETVAAACNKLGLAGFQCGSTTQQPSNVYQSGYVISTNPSAGTQEPQGTTVNLVVSSGPPSSTTTTSSFFGTTTTKPGGP
jgi:serine/threonine-protein kinase